MGKRIFLLAQYILPQEIVRVDNSKNIYEPFEEILYFQDKGDIILQGNFNARTNVDNDTITPHKT